MARIGMKVNFHEGIPLKREVGTRRKFAVLIPPHCETVEDVKEFFLEEFCPMTFTRLELCIDSSFALRDEEPVDLILFFSKLDKLFEVFPKSWVDTSTTSLSSSFIKANFMLDVDEGDSRPSSSINSSSSRASKRKRESEHHEQDSDADEDDEDDDNHRTFLRHLAESTPLNTTDKSSKSSPSNKAIELTAIVENQDTTGEKMTKSAKRRNRLKRSVAKRVRLTPKPIEDEQLEDPEKENQKVEDTLTGQTEAGSADTNFAVPTSLPPRRVLRSRTRKSTPLPRPPQTVRFESVVMKFEDKKEKEENEALDSTAAGPSTYDQTYYEGLPPAGPIDDIKLQDVVAFQVWEFCNGGPELSKYCEARVIGKDGDMLTLEYLKGRPSSDSTKAVEIEGYIEDTSYGLGFKAEMNLDFLLNIKKIDPATSPPTDI